MVEVPGTGILWISGLTFAGAVVSWFVRLERRLGTFMTRREQSSINGQHQATVAAELAAISAKLDEQNKSSAEHREKQLTALHELALDLVAVQTKVGVGRRRKIQRDPV